MKLAIVYDWFDKWGGAERILEILFNNFPEADIYSLYADYQQALWAKKYQLRIRTTFLNRFYKAFPSKQLLAPIMPFATESLDLSDYDVVLSLSSSFMKGIITRPETKHICYLFSPTRFLWHQEQRFFSSHFLLRPFLSWLRQWDFIAAQKPDRIFTLSQYDQKLIKKYYRRNSEILLPPFDLNYWRKLNPRRPKIKMKHPFFLLVARLEPNKNTELAIKTFNKLPQHQLVIIGKGTRAAELKRIAQRNISFINEVTDSELAWFYRQAAALIMPQAEDFGYTALEAICFETPVISYAKSGTAEILNQSQAGILFQEPTTEALANALEKSLSKSYNFSNFDWGKYSQPEFLRQLTKFISS